MIRPIVIRRVLADLAILIFFIMSCASCASMTSTIKIVNDYVGEGRPKGYVAFFSHSLSINISRLQDGKEIDEGYFMYNNKRPRGFAMVPGKHEFIIYHNKYKKHLVVPVLPDAITYVSVLRETISSGSTQWMGSSSTYSTYYVHTSIGSTPLPMSPEQSDLETFTTALLDQDYGTRFFALKGLAQKKIVPNSTTLERIRLLAERDSCWRMNNEAANLLKALGEEAPRIPIRSYNFQQDSYGWYQGSKEGTSDYYFDSDGYNVVSKIDSCVWCYSPWTISKKNFVNTPNYDVEVEASWKSGIDNEGYGFLLSYSNDDNYSFYVSKNGGAIVRRVQDSITQNPPIPWQNHVRQSISSSDVNKLKLEVRGKNATYLVNGTVIGTFLLVDGFIPINIGVIVEGKQAAVFRSILIEEKQEL